ncbi:MAG TPA: leishmanolysin-related zinc metalloendopeptidase [Pyrinomonadaceae bacterium]|nr:leishmanolysin-related zinc metalloendopeptidase [Pyrinomonadaceae bacterium]
MSQIEIYRARAGAEVTAEAAAATAGVVSPFTIEVRFRGGLTNSQKNAFKAAADRWSRLIVGDLPSVQVDGEVIDDVLIEAQGSNIDGPGGILGQAGPTHVRPASAGASAFLPVKGIMAFDKADLASMQQNGTLGDVITHEMGHVLGIGTIWDSKGLLQNAGTSNPTFTGAGAMAEFGQLKGAAATAVPVENTGGPGTADGHWRETVFRNELMSGFISAAGNPISRVTAASLEDLGYVVNMEAAEPFALPNLLELAESGSLTSHIAPINLGIMIPSIPIVMPDESVQP